MKILSKKKDNLRRKKRFKEIKKQMTTKERKNLLTFSLENIVKEKGNGGTMPSEICCCFF